jgi:DNA-binding SARP family transcriptional activator
MDFRVLGSLEVWDGERQLDLGGAKRRLLLALLLLHANEVVAADRLVDQLWGERAPGNAAGALQSHVSRLRKELGPDVVGTRAWGYVLRVEPGALDLERFERLSLEAENLPAGERAGKLREALALWRGSPLADVAFEPSLAGDIARLEELRLTVLENRIDADLESGNEAGLVGELEALIAMHPLRERLRGQLILALYRSGRQAEALEVYRETRRVLADELGLEPSPELRELERAILQQDPALRASPVRAPVAAVPGVRPGRRRRIYIAASLAVLLVGVGAATADALSARPTHAAQPRGHPLRWTSLEHAPSGVIRYFANSANFKVGGPPGATAQPIAREARTVPLPPLVDSEDGRVALSGGGVVDVTPALKGGFCTDDGCDPSRAYPINATTFAGGCGASDRTRPTLLVGHVNAGLVKAKPGSMLRVSFSDGDFTDIALTWVGPPISAGFFQELIAPGMRIAGLSFGSAEAGGFEIQRLPACGGGVGGTGGSTSSRRSASAYRAQLQKTVKEAVAASYAAAKGLQASSVRQLVTVLTAEATSFKRMGAEVAALNPPTELEAANTEFGKGMRDRAAEIDALLPKINNMPSAQAAHAYIRKIATEWLSEGSPGEAYREMSQAAVELTQLGYITGSDRPSRPRRAQNGS